MKASPKDRKGRVFFAMPVGIGVGILKFLGRNDESIEYGNRIAAILREGDKVGGACGKYAHPESPGPSFRRHGA
jgi:hypothetical protein